MNPPPNFNNLARIYRWMEMATFGPTLWHCRCYFLDEMRDRQRALVLGDGDGRFTARLLGSNSEIQVDAVDASPAMLKAFLRRAGEHARRIEVQCDDIRLWSPKHEKYDLVVSHFFLDCLTSEEVGALAAKIQSCLTPDARWLISEFAIPDRGVGRVIARCLVKLLYFAFGSLTGLRVRQLPKHAESLARYGFIPHKQKILFFGILRAEIWLRPVDRMLQTC